jgi:hypothetical protein
MATAKKTIRKNPCWPGFEPVPGKKPRRKGSCKPKPGTPTKSTRRATQKAAAASLPRKSRQTQPQNKNVLISEPASEVVSASSPTL